MEASSTISDYIRLTTKMERTRQSIDFVTTCIKEQLVPSFIRVNLGNRLTQSQLKRLRTTMLKNELHKHYSILNKISNSRYRTYQKLYAEHHFLQSEEIFKLAQEITFCRTHSGNMVKSNKLVRLRLERER